MEMKGETIPVQGDNMVLEPTSEEPYESLHCSDDDEAELPGSRTPPENDLSLQDEPSSVLASRVSRAQDNPSPPPTPMREVDAQRASSSFDGFQIQEDDDNTKDPTYLVLHILPPDLTTPLDAITHKVVNTAPVDIHMPSNLPPGSPQPQQNSLFLFPPDAASFKGKERENLVDQAEEDAVMAALIETHSDTSTPPLPEPEPVPIEASLETLETPLRRSTRPRRSTSTFDSPMRQFFVQTSTQKKKRKAQELDNTPPPPLPSGLNLLPSPSRSQSPVLDGYLVDDLKAKEERRQARLKQRATEQQFQRELGSLSPATANLLSGLSAEFSTPKPKQPAFNFASEPSSLDTEVDNMQTPTNAPSARLLLDSPVRSASALPDPNRTPARRVPFDQAQVSSLKPRQNSVLRVPSFTTRPGTDSPARRVPISSAHNRLKVPSQSPTRPRSRSPSAFIDRPTFSLQQTKPALSAKATIGSKSSKLPFPLVPTASSSSGILGRSESPSKAQLAPLRPSPEKSVLKQPSRIPRMRSTPYTRPIAIKPSVEPLVKPPPSADVSTPAKNQKPSKTSSPSQGKPFVLISSVPRTSSSPLNKSIIAAPVIDPIIEVPAEKSPLKNIEPAMNEDILPVPEPKRSLRPKSLAFAPPADSTNAESSRPTPRTIRPRKVGDKTDAFRAALPKPARKAPKERTVPSADLFSGLSATALKELTTTNTVKNQNYLIANLDVQVIRKDGIRPESPPVKVRTISQRLQEERALSRKVRADRRAGIGADVDSEWQSDQEDMNLPVKHPRGPGEDEDFESPEKLARPFKRLKLDGTEEDQPARRVKWNKGLSTSVCLDDVQPGTRVRLNDKALKKGCLAISARTLQLDTLGNLPNIDVPLPDLVKEDVVIKKFVYDNDVLPVVIEPKTTRSKSKKGKN